MSLKNRLARLEKTVADTVGGTCSTCGGPVPYDDEATAIEVLYRDDAPPPRCPLCYQPVDEQGHGTGRADPRGSPRPSPPAYIVVRTASKR